MQVGFQEYQFSARLLAHIPTIGLLRSHNIRTLPEDVIFSGTLADLANIPRQRVEGFALQRAAARADCLMGRPRVYAFHLVNDAQNYEKAAAIMAHFEGENENCTARSPLV